VTDPEAAGDGRNGPDERPVLPDRSRDEEDSGWGDRVTDEDAEDIRRFLEEKPPHHTD